MAGKSKSSKEKENSENPEEVDASDTGPESKVSDSESSGDAPVVIEGEATEVASVDAGSGAPEDDDTPEPAEAASEDQPDDDAQETGPEPAIPVAHAPEPARQGTGISVLALVFGGIVAGAIGYFGAVLAPKPAAPVFDSTELSEGIAANEAALAALETSVGALQGAEPPEVDLSGVEGELAAVSQSLDGVAGDLDALRTRLDDVAAEIDRRATELDERVVALETAVPGAGDLETAEELGALRRRIEEMMAEAETRLAEAQAEADAIARAAAETRAAAEAEAARVAEEAAAREAELRATAERQTALVELKTAVETGSGYAAILPVIGEVPEALAATAQDGVPTMQALQQSFPPAARQALSQAETVPADASAGDRLTAFLKRRTNARSLTPRDGSSPDAVLSRAEARLGEGDLAGALEELEALPEPGRTALGDWLEDARARLSALEAVDELTATN